MVNKDRFNVNSLDSKMSGGYLHIIKSLNRRRMQSIRTETKEEIEHNRIEMHGVQGTFKGMVFGNSE